MQMHKKSSHDMFFFKPFLRIIFKNQNSTEMGK